MRELSLHILDLVENSLRAGARTVAISIEAEQAGDVLRIIVEDDGRGLKVRPQQALDPFYTTKPGKRTGLGLSLFKAAAEATGGRLTIGKSELGSVGVRVTAELGLAHVDRAPLGDLAGTLATLVCTNPGIDFRFRLRCGELGTAIHSAQLLRELGLRAGDGLALGHAMRERVAAELKRCPELE